MEEKVKEFLKAKNSKTKQSYQRAFDLFYEYTEKEIGEKITGEKLVKKVAEDRRKNIEDRERPEVNLLKGFFKWLGEKAPKKRGKGKGYSSKTCHAYLSGITEFLNHNDLPIDKKKLSLPKATRKKNNRKVNIRRDQVRKMVKHAKTNRDKAVILCLWQSGMSISDLLNLDISDVMLEDPIRGSLDDPPLLIKLNRQKSGVDYRTFFGQDACRSLKTYLDERERTIGPYERSDPLFLQQRKKNGTNYKRFTIEAAEMMFRRIVKRSGIVSEDKMKEADFNPARPHALRSGFSSVLKEEGVNQSIIDGLTGHSVGYDSAYHNFTDKQLRELYQDHEDVLSIEQVSIPRESEIEEAVKKHFGEMGAERIMPDLREKIENQGSKVEELEKEVEELRDKMEKIDQLEQLLDSSGELEELKETIEESVERALLEKEE
ncbi:hypothetical protein AKJ49_00510 [candidate division MSBL1 archaeon SCGC-AAA382A03]|uniref:Tyr recombinase domain-containing protein n=1 Tax=candidate division MSBL1 archaeon SCGC-AAA382A03 TaxID=1698278 RepID=A0A133VGN1_9EURY|nr:hypothetical protein AKJ49_00510 [candidate division MSBL1 archaeon SCGC-AAA382A03]